MKTPYFSQDSVPLRYTPNQTIGFVMSFSSVRDLKDVLWTFAHRTTVKTLKSIQYSLSQSVQFVSISIYPRERHTLPPH